MSQDPGSRVTEGSSRGPALLRTSVTWTIANIECCARVLFVRCGGVQAEYLDIYIISRYLDIHEFSLTCKLPPCVRPLRAAAA